MKKSFKQGTIFILVFFLILGMGIGPYVNAENNLPGETQIVNESLEIPVEEKRVEEPVEEKPAEEKRVEEPVEEKPEEKPKPEPEPKYQTLIVNYLKLEEGRETLLRSKILDRLEVDSVVNLFDLTKEYEDYEAMRLLKVETFQREVIEREYIIREGRNELNLYYEMIKNQEELEPERPITPEPTPVTPEPEPIVPEEKPDPVKPEKPEELPVMPGKPIVLPDKPKEEEVVEPVKPKEPEVIEKPDPIVPEEKPDPVVPVKPEKPEELPVAPEKPIVLPDKPKEEEVVEPVKPKEPEVIEKPDPVVPVKPIVLPDKPKEEEMVEPVKPKEPDRIIRPNRPIYHVDLIDDLDLGQVPKGNPQAVKEKTTLKINHLEKVKDEEFLIEAETIEGLEVEVTVYALDYVKEFEGLKFIESDLLEIFLVKENNEINLYYGFEDEINLMGESPDFLPGEEIDEPLPYIQEFAPGELGPFEEEEIEKYSRMSMFNIMNTESNTVKNGTTASYSDEVNNKEWPEPGSLKIDKVGGSIDGSGNEFEVELKIEGKNRIQTSDIVLVMDRSGSMGSGGRMTNAKVAAVSFVNKLLDDPNNTSTRIALVSFSGDVTVNRQFTGYSGKAGLISAINGLNANGGTHIQAGIRQGIAVLNGSSAMNKSIVFLGDGAATYSYKPTNPNNYLEFWKHQSSRDYYRTRTDIVGFDYGTRVGPGNNEYQQYESGGSTWFGTAYSNNYRLGAHAIAEARLAPADHNIYTIALGAGTEGDWTLQNMANSGYYSTPNPANLEAIYDEIAGSILSAATNAIVTDPLEDMYDILGINTSNYNTLIDVSHGTLSWDNVTEKITWNIGTISQGTVYTMKYKVALDYSVEGGVFYPANKPTYIEYKNIDNANAKKYFPIPEFRLRELTISKTLTNGKAGDGNKEFYITLEGPSGPYKKTWTVSVKPGESKTIKGLLPGNYTVKETVPMNFELVGISPGSLFIGENDWKRSVNVANKRSNDGWFWDDPDPKINSFTVGNSTSARGSLPTEDKSLYGRLDYFLIPTTLEKEHKLYQG